MYKVTIETSESNPQNNFASAPLLSELCIKLPKPQSTPRKPNFMLPYQDQYQESPRQYQPSPPQSRQIQNANNISIKTDSNCFIFSGTRTKNSSASLPFRSQSEIITEWVCTLFQKKGLLGPHWEEKLRNKRKKQLLDAFVLLKESVEGQCSAYLQTQSLYKPAVKRMNKLLALGCDKILQILPVIINRNCQSAFSKILRFIAFQHMSNKGSRNEQNPIISMQSIGNSLKSSRNNNFHSKPSIQYQASTKNSYGQYNVYTNEKHTFKNQDYQISRSHEQLKQATSLKYLSYNPNQYVMKPVSPMAIHQPKRIPEEQKVIRNINLNPFTSEQKLLQVRESPNLHCSPKTTLLMPDYRSLDKSKQIYVSTNPPSPKTHQFTPIVPQTCVPQPQNIEFDKAKNKNPLKSLAFDNVRQSKIRPHSHNPFSSKHITKETLATQNNQPEKVENRKSRAISSSPNIKISFIAQPVTPNPHTFAAKQKMNDYETDHSTPNHNNLYKLGTLQNRQMRQSYQANSMQNELIGQTQNQLRVNQPISYAFSSPVSPKTVPNVVQFQTIRVNPPSPTTHYILKPQQPYRQQKSRPSFRNEPNDYYMKKREKLVVTSSNKRKY